MSKHVRLDNVYADYASATPIDAEVRFVMCATQEYANPSALHSSGRRMREEIEQVRARILKILSADDYELYFTGSGTESDNLALCGVAHAYKNKGRHILVSAVEHKAVIESAESLRDEGFEVEYIPVDDTGRVDPEKVGDMLRTDTILVSVMHVNNELGTIEPIADIARIVKEKSTALLHTDACQSIGLFTLPEADLITFNGSKIYGPRGIGVLAVRNGVHITPILYGGGQEHGVRPGTESLMAINGLATAVEKAESLRTSESVRLSTLREHFIVGLQERIPDIHVNGGGVPHIVHVTVPYIEGESILLALDAVGIAVSTGSACSSKDLRPSHVLKAIGQSDDLMHGSIRFSFGRQTTREDIEYILQEFPSIVERLRAVSVLTTHAYAT